MAADRPLTGYDRERSNGPPSPSGGSVSRRWLTVAIVLGVAALAVGATALILPLAVPGYPGSLAPAPPQTLYDKQLDAPIRESCTAYNQMGNCVSFREDVVGFDNFTVAGTAGALGVVNVSYGLNHSCGSCFLEIFRGNLSEGPVFISGFAQIVVFLNGSGEALGLLAAGVNHLILVNQQALGYSGPVSLRLTILYLGTLSYR